MGYHIGGGKVKYICLIGCRLPPLDGYMAVCLVLTIEVYDQIDAIGLNFISLDRKFNKFDQLLSRAQRGEPATAVAQL